jgi:heme/copper-type cytochrome/quinol oxidase subunit 2
MVSTLGRIVRRGAWALGGILLASGQALAAWELDMPVGKSILADEIMGLHHLILLICTVICVALFGFAFFVMFKYRRSKGAKAVRITHSTLAETIWTTIPTLILIFMATMTISMKTCFSSRRSIARAMRPRKRILASTPVRSTTIYATSTSRWSSRSTSAFACC